MEIQGKPDDLPAGLVFDRQGRAAGGGLANANPLPVLDFDKLRLKVHFLFTIHEIVFSKVIR